LHSTDRGRSTFLRMTGDRFQIPRSRRSRDQPRTLCGRADTKG